MGTKVIVSNTFIENNNGHGSPGSDGAAFNIRNGASVAIKNCSLKRNTAYWDGGAIFVDGATVVITESFLYANTALTGGMGEELFVRIQTNLQKSLLKDSTLSENTAGSSGNELYINMAIHEIYLANVQMLPTITSNTVSGNGAIKLCTDVPSPCGPLPWQLAVVIAEDDTNFMFSVPLGHKQSRTRPEITSYPPSSTHQ